MALGDKGNHSNFKFYAVSCYELLGLAVRVRQIRSIFGDAPYIVEAYWQQLCN